MPYIIVTMLGLAVFIGGVIFIKGKQSEEKKYYDTACQMVKEEYLTWSLRRTDRQDSRTEAEKMVYLKFCSSRKKQGYVFNPEQEIIMGRAKERCTIWIPSPIVSLVHCRIFLYQQQIYIQDLNSSNGTIVKKGWRKYLVQSGQSLILDTNDKIYIGNTVFKVTIFDFSIRQK